MGMGLEPRGPAKGFPVLLTQQVPASPGPCWQDGAGLLAAGEAAARGVSRLGSDRCRAPWGAGWGPEAGVCLVLWHLCLGCSGAERCCVPFIDLCEVVNRAVITPCLRCCANSVPVQLGPGPRGRGDPPATLASLTDTFAGIIDGEPAGPAGHFVTGVLGRCALPQGEWWPCWVAFTVREGRRCSGGRGAVGRKCSLLGSRLSLPASPPETRQPGRGPDRGAVDRTLDRPALPGGEGYTQRSEVDPARCGSAGQTGALQSLQPGPNSEYGGASCPP